MPGRDVVQPRPEVVALAYHVDYWDYIGWPDTFGNKDHSDRQRAYATAWGSSRIFTPQLIVNGSDGVVASRKDEVEGVLARSVEDAERGVTTHSPWVPYWYGGWASSPGTGAGIGRGGLAPGLMSASALPSFSGMFAALSSVGSAPSSSGSGSSGGFSGGGGGGGGGGAGGGF